MSAKNMDDIAEVFKTMKFSKKLIGGVDEFSILNHGVTEKQMADHFAEAIEAEGTGKLILGPGCCVPLNVSENRLETAKRALASL